jgi:hypothetical protein
VAQDDPALALQPSRSVVVPLPLLYQSYTSNEAQDSAYEGIMVVTWFNKVMTDVTKF